MHDTVASTSHAKSAVQARTSHPAGLQSPGLPLPAPLPALPGQLREVFVRCSDEAAEQIRRGAMSGESPAVRLAARMLRDSARSIGALVLADVCDRLANARPDKLIDAACQWSDLIDRLVIEVREDFIAVAPH